MSKQALETVRLDKIVGGGQAIGTLADGRKAFVWGGLPGELVEIQITKKKSKLIEGVVREVIEAADERITPLDEASYMSTSPWQIMSFASEQKNKISLIKEAFILHNISLPDNVEIYTDGIEYGYRNKVEFSWYSDIDEESGADTLDLAFFRRGSRGKVIVEGTSLAREEINKLAVAIRDLLRDKNISARQLKTLLIRSDQEGNCVWQLYTKDHLNNLFSEEEVNTLPAQGGEVIYSDPKSPASRITERLQAFGNTMLTDTILDVPFHYTCEGFFQVNIPVYQTALKDMAKWIEGSSNKNVTDLYSGVGTIGLTIGGDAVTLVEINEYAVAEMKRNITALGRRHAQAVLAPSEKALSHLDGKDIVIIDPPRAGLHADVVEKLLQTKPEKIIYLSCNPVTQARDIALLTQSYTLTETRGYNFFPRTPHIETACLLTLSQ